MSVCPVTDLCRQAETAKRGLQRGVGSGQAGPGLVPGRNGYRASRGDQVGQCTSNAVDNSTCVCMCVCVGGGVYVCACVFVKA